MRFIPVITLVAMAGCGGAQAATRDFPVTPFDRISNSTPFDVHVHVGGAPAVRAEASPETLDRLQVNVNGGRLIITSRRGSWTSMRHEGRTLIDVTVPSLKEVQVNGPGDMTVDNARADQFAVRLDGPGDVTVASLQAHALDVVLNGPGDVRLAGHADTATLALHGPGDIKAADLSVRDATVTLNGPGDLSFRATGVVRGSVSGPGDLTVRGGARCELSKHGPGDLDCR
jgi:hypothetical protein